METTVLKRFAQTARRSLTEQVAARLNLVLMPQSAARRESGVWGVTEQEMHLSPLPAIISTIFPRFNLNMAMPRICLATNII